MEEWEREDLIIGVAMAIEKNFCAIEPDELFKKFKNTDSESLRDAIDSMEIRGMLKYDIDQGKYRLIL